MAPQTPLYQAAGVDADAAQSGLEKIIERIRGTWPAAGQKGAVKLDIGYFANVIDIGGGLGAGDLDRRGRLEVDRRRHDAEIRHDRHRLRRDERQRFDLRRRAAAVAGRLHRRRTRRCGDAGRHRGRACRGRPPGRDLDFGRRNLAIAGHRPRFRSGRHGGRARGARLHPDRRSARPWRCHHRRRKQRHPRQRPDIGAAACCSTGRS